MSHSLQNLGYAPDFVQVAMAPYLKDIKKKGRYLLQMFNRYIQGVEYSGSTWVIHVPCLLTPCFVSPGDCFTNVLQAFQNNLRKYTIPEITFMMRISS